MLWSYYPTIVESLAHDSMMGRPAGSVFEQQCAAIILREFRQLKRAKPHLQLFTFKHPDSLLPGTALNVYCYLNNRKDSTILIMAHYDHIGLGGKLSKSFGKKEVHNGADDNASGIALLLGLFKNYAHWKNSKYNYLFLACSAHEIGLFGSDQFYEFMNTQKKIKPISLVLNFDMVGRMHPDLRWLKVIATENSVISSLIADKMGALNIRKESELMLLQTDAKRFYQNDIPCISFTTGIHDDYHKTTDDVEKINYNGVLRIQRLIEALLMKM